MDLQTEIPKFLFYNITVSVDPLFPFWLVSCIIWETEEVKKVDLTVLDLGWTIIQKVRLCIMILWSRRQNAVVVKYSQTLEISEDLC